MGTLCVGLDGGLAGDDWTMEHLSGLSSVEVLGSSEYLPSGSNFQE